PGLAGASGGEDDRLGPEEDEPPRVPPVAEKAGDPVPVQNEVEPRALHVDLEALVDAVVLERPDDLEAGPIADVREARIAVASEIALADQTVLGAIENRPPFLQLAHAVGGLPRMELGHAPLVEELAAPHRVAEVDLPVVARVAVPARLRPPALGHPGRRLAKER